MENKIFIKINNNSRKSNDIQNIQNQSKENEIFITKKLLSPSKSKLKDSQVKFITKKSFNERNECKKKHSDNLIFNEGRWSKEEHEKFLEGIVLYNVNWKKVKTLIETRTPMQVRSHAQKFFNKMKLCKDENLGIDFTSNKVHNFTDMINQIKNKNCNYHIINVFKYLTDKYDNLEKQKKNIVDRNDNNIIFQKTELNYQSNIINLEEDKSNINDNYFFFNQININKSKRMNETQNINDKGSNDITNAINQINKFNILQNILTMNYNSNVFNSLLPSNLYFSFYDNTNIINNLLINNLISNNQLNVSNIINENVLLSLSLQNNIMNNINNINNNINLKDINFCANINNYNNIRNISNGNNIDKVKDNDENSLFFNFGEKDNINLRDNNNNDYNYIINDIDNKNYNININKNNFHFSSDKQLSKNNDEKKNNNDENSKYNNIFD